MRSCDKKVRKKNLDNKKWNLKKIKTRETKVWLQKEKKGRKIKKLGHHRNWKSRKTKNTLFPYYQKNHNSINDSEKKINPFLPNEKIADSSTWFFLLLFFLSCSLPPIVAFLSNFWQKKPDYATTRPLLLHTTITIIC